MNSIAHSTRKRPGVGLTGAGAPGFAFLLALTMGLTTLADSNPYSEVILTRNVFGLKDPPPPPPPPDNTPPAPKITLVGIANIFGTRKAVLKTQPAPGTAPKPATPGAPPPGQEPPLVLVEGAMQDGITVLSIDEATGTVKVDNNGQTLTLSFDKDGLKVPSGPAAPASGVPGIPGQPAIPRPPGLPTLPGVPTPLPGAVAAGGAQPPTPTVPAGMTEEMRQRFLQRYGIQPGQAAVPTLPQPPGSVAR